MQSSGGTYSGDLLLDFTTHLVYKDQSLAEQGEKYATAKSWGIPVLPFAWLQDSAKRKRILPSSFVPQPALPDTASPATKLQQLCLHDDRPNILAAAHRPMRSSPVEVQAPSEPVKLPIDAGSQLHGPGTLHDMAQHQSHLQITQSSEAAELASCHGSCEPGQLEQDVPSFEDPQDADGSETCSNRSDIGAAGCDIELQADAAQTKAPGPLPTDDLIIPDSQPDNSLGFGAVQLTVPVTSSANEPGFAWAEPDASGQAHFMTSIPDSPLDVMTGTSYQLEHEKLLRLRSSPGADWHHSIQISGQQQPLDCLVADSSEASPGHSCEAVPDTEPQASPSTSLPAHPSLFAAPAATSSSTDSRPASVTPNLEAMHADAPPKEHQQKEQLHQLWQQGHLQHLQGQQQQGRQLPQPQPQQPPQSVCSSSAGSPSTSYASHAFVIEDSDSESDFQPLKPARPSSSSSHSSAHRANMPAVCKPVQHGKRGVVPVKLMSRYPRGTSVKEHYGLASLKGVQFAEQLQVGRHSPTPYHCASSHLLTTLPAVAASGFFQHCTAHQHNCC